MRRWLLALLVVLGSGILAVLAGVAYFFVTLFLSRGEANKLNYFKGEETCLSIPAYAYETANIFNPSDAQTAYIRSKCFLKLATEERNEEYCQYVKERKSMLYDGSAYSPEKCLAAVSGVQEIDASEAIIPSNIHAIEQLQIAASGSGIYSVRVTTEGSQKGSYNLSIALHDTGGKLVIQLHQEVISFGESSQTLTRTINPQSELVKDFGQQYYDTVKGKTFIVRVELELLTDAYHLEKYNVPSIPEAALKSSAEHAITL